MGPLSKSDFERLLQLRSALRRYMRWTEGEAKAAGMTPAQHQLLLAIRGHPDPIGPTIGDVADYLLVRHHSAVGLVDRAESAGLIERRRDPANSATVRLALTPVGVEKLETLVTAHRQELAGLDSVLDALSRALEASGGQLAHHVARPAWAGHTS